MQGGDVSLALLDDHQRAVAKSPEEKHKQDAKAAKAKG